METGTMTYDVNDRVRVRTAPDKEGRITGKIRERAGRNRYQVDFGNCQEYVLESHSFDARRLRRAKAIHAPAKSPLEVRSARLPLIFFHDALLRAVGRRPSMDDEGRRPATPLSGRQASLSPLSSASNHRPDVRVGKIVDRLAGKGALAGEGVREFKPVGAACSGDWPLASTVGDAIASHNPRRIRGPNSRTPSSRKLHHQEADGRGRGRRKPTAGMWFPPGFLRIPPSLGGNVQKT